MATGRDWVRALKNSDERQVFNSLKGMARDSKGRFVGVGYCATGIACLIDNSGVFKYGGRGFYFYETKQDDNFADLPSGVSKELIDISRKKIYARDLNKSLIDLFIAKNKIIKTKKNEYLWKENDKQLYAYLYVEDLNDLLKLNFYEIALVIESELDKNE